MHFILVSDARLIRSDLLEIVLFIDISSSLLNNQYYHLEFLTFG